MPIKAFISYKRSGIVLDDRAAKFHNLLESELGYIDPESSVFLDKENMGAGDVFPEVLRERVESADVLIVLLSPAWLQSNWCREEYTCFSQQEDGRDYTPRILPLLWVATPQLENPEGDDIAKALSRINYQEFERLRHFDHNSPEYSQVLADLAKRVKHVSDHPRRKTNGDVGSTDKADLGTMSRPKPSDGESTTGVPQDFDCFLSHNRKDKQAVRDLADKLRAAGVSVWLDEAQLRPGVPWQSLLESGIRASRSVAVLVGSDGLGPWQDQEQQAVINLAVTDNGYSCSAARRPFCPKTALVFE